MSACIRFNICWIESMPWRFFPRVIVFFFFLSPVYSQITGSQDYGLGGSSVAWLPRSSALFLNPSYLARLHQGDVHMTTNRFADLSSLSLSSFFPFAGTFAAGVGNEFGRRHFGIGYGFLLGRDVAVGTGFNVVRSHVDYGGLSLGMSTHLFHGGTMNSGLLFGASVLNLGQPSVLRSSIGAGWWVFPNVVRLQSAWLYRPELGQGTVGLVVRINPWFSLFTGTAAFKEAAGGVEFRSSYLTADVAFGNEGVSLSLNLRFTDDSRDVRDKYFSHGVKAYEESRYGEAYHHFALAVEYDEYYEPARRFSSLALSGRDTTVAVYLREGERHELSGNFPAAIESYTLLLKADPGNENATSRLTDLEAKFRVKVEELVVLGDSLQGQKKFERARSAYEEALRFDPEDADIRQKIAVIDSTVRERIQYHSSRARNFVAKNQIDDARREFEQVLIYDPKNTQALNAIESLKARRTAVDLFARGKTLFDQGNYFDALAIFLDILQREPNNKDARSYVERSREALQNEVEPLFKIGLQWYIKENYQTALDVWGRVLLIQPHHQATLEYSKRAREKIEALEKLR